MQIILCIYYSPVEVYAIIAALWTGILRREGTSLMLRGTEEVAGSRVSVLQCLWFSVLTAFVSVGTIRIGWKLLRKSVNLHQSIMLFFIIMFLVMFLNVIHLILKKMFLIGLSTRHWFMSLCQVPQWLYNWAILISFLNLTNAQCGNEQWYGALNLLYSLCSILCFQVSHFHGS